jgi:hypothetical protein
MYVCMYIFICVHIDIHVYIYVTCAELCDKVCMYTQGLQSAPAARRARTLQRLEPRRPHLAVPARLDGFRPPLHRAAASCAQRASTLVKQALPSVSPAPWASTLPPWAHCPHPLACRVRRHLADTARLAQSLPQVHSVLRATTVWVEPVISRHAVRTQASTAQLDLHLQQEHSALLVFTVLEVRVTSNRVPWARTFPILAPLSTAQSARPGRFQHLHALCQKVLAPSVQQGKRRNRAAMISQIAPRLPPRARMRFVT